MWCFGVLLYYLCTGDQLFRMNVREEVSSLDELKKIVMWSDEDWEKEVERRIQPEWSPMKPLLLRLLKKEPEKRYFYWKHIIKDLDDADYSKMIRENNEKINAKLQEVGNKVGVTQHAVLETRDLVSEQSKILQYLKSSIDQIPHLMVQLEEVEFPYMFTLLTAHEFEIFKRTLMSEPSLDKQASDGVEGVVKFIGRAQESFACCRDFLDSLNNKETATALRKGWQLISGKTTEVVYLQLLCGLTLQPLVSYKIATTTYREEIKKFAEIGAKVCVVGVTVATLWNVAGGFAKAFGYHIPNLPGDVVLKAKNFLDEVNKSSPVEGLKEYKKSGFNLNQMKEFKEFVEDLESKGMMRHCLQECDKKALKSRTWHFALKKHVLTDLPNYEKQVTFISVSLKSSFGGDTNYECLT